MLKPTSQQNQPIQIGLHRANDVDCRSVGYQRRGNHESDTLARSFSIAEVDPAEQAYSAAASNNGYDAFKIEDHIC